MNTKLNKSDFYLLSCFFIVSFLMQGRDYYYRDALLREYFIDFPIEILTISAIVSLFVLWLIPSFMINKRYFHFTIIGVFILVSFTSIEYIAGFWSGDNDWAEFPKPVDFFFKMINKGTNLTAFPFALLLTKKFYEGQTQLLKAEKQQKENELKLLRSQIDPHFLFNNLNTLDALIDSNPNKAKEYINRLSLIYRYLIKTKDSEVMELSEELLLAENYMFLIKTRFGDDYDFKIDKQIDLEDKFIPTGSIQTLLENVVKHNKPLNGNSIKTIISINKNRLKVANSKTSIKSENESFGTGLKNLKLRYKLLSNKEIIVINMNTEFKVYIPIINLIEEN